MKSWFLTRIKKFPRHLRLWLAITSLILPLVGQSVREVELEKSSNLNVWESVTITPDMVSSTGELIVPASGLQQFHRIKVSLVEAPSISNQPPATTYIQEGESVTFTVGSQGEGLTYQWYQGESGDTSQPIQGATSQTYNSGALDSDTSYWVKVSNVAGSTNSETIRAAVGYPPEIVSQPTSLTITSGNTATLMVSATGPAPFTYQWYRGNLGSTAAPVGTNSSTFTTPPLTVTTKYWVKITNAFGEASSSSAIVTVEPNTTPTISDITDQSIIEGSIIGTLSFTVNDVHTSPSSLTLSGSSSNTTLVPNANIIFGGSGENRTVTVTPASGQSGTATITVTVSDGSLSTSDTFVLTVIANTAPGVNLNYFDQTINEGGTMGPQSFYIWDAQTEASLLTLSGSSSDTNLVPDANIVFGGSEAYRTVTVTPASGQSGIVTITVTVSDGSLSTSNTFVLTVNSTPTISNITDQSINSGISTGAIPFTIGDTITAASSLTLSGSSSNTTLVPNANIIFGGSGENRTVTVTPASGKSGTATITVTVSDGPLSASDTFVLTVNSAPTISNIADQTVIANGNTGALSFMIGDAQTAASSLTLSSSSSNTTLVPNANIVFDDTYPLRGYGYRTVTVTPAGGQSGTVTITVTVSDGSLSMSDTFVLTINPAAAMVFIPAGAFTMGNSVAADTDITNAPTRTVILDAFYISNYEVTKAEWQEVRTWGLSNGYSDLSAGSGKASYHPVQTVSFYDVLKWCNARSEKEGLSPVYLVSSSVMRTGMTDPTVDWSANGYRLPTEAEWEKAARGGLPDKRFPWGDTINHSQANYQAKLSYNYDLSGGLAGYNQNYTSGGQPYTSPVGTFESNGYGLHDVAGNVSEWCWDGYATYAAGSQTNPRGPTGYMVTSRVIRGGGWVHGADYCRVAYRESAGPGGSYNYWGFRVACSSSH
jgi:formylglycine-generating enzyme required for sulfatase activity